MSYCAKTDLIDRFGEDELIQLTDRTGSGVIDDDVLNRAIADADGQIDGYLANRYTLPLSSVPDVLVRIACDLARYWLYEDAVSDQVRRRYEDAIKYLEGIAKGLVSLGSTTEETAGSPEMVSDGNVFGRDNVY